MHKVAPPPPAEGLQPEAVLRKIRIPCIQRATIEVSGVREDLFMIDLGLRGVFLERSLPVPEGAEIAIWFALPGNELRVHARCRVAWVRPVGIKVGARTLPAGLGLEFVSMASHDAGRVRHHLIEYLRRHPRDRRFLRHPEEAEEEA